MSNNLKAGEFYGLVPNKRDLSGLTLTEVVHSRPVSVPRHSHELGHFQLLLQGSYLENCGGKSIASRPMTISWHRPGIIHKDEIGRDGGRFFMIEMQPRLVEQPPDGGQRAEPAVGGAAPGRHQEEDVQRTQQPREQDAADQAGGPAPARRDGQQRPAGDNRRAGHREHRVRRHRCR